MGVFPTRKKCRGLENRQYVPQNHPYTVVMAPQAMVIRGYNGANFEVPGTFYWLRITPYTIYFSESPRFQLFKNGHRGTQKMTRTQKITISEI